MKRPSHPHSTHATLPFSEPERPARIHVANVDGASRGNPGPASYAVVLRGPDGNKEFEIGKYVGRTTNNVAEYYGLIAALDYATSHGIERLRVQSDSELMVRQMQGRYKVKSPELKPLHERAQKMARGLTFFAIEHVMRERNSDADALANRALDDTSTHGARGAATAAPPSQSASAARRQPQRTSDGTIRARYSNGALHPLEALNLDEGEMVEIKISRK